MNTNNTNITHVYAQGMTKKEKKDQRVATRKALRNGNTENLSVANIPTDWLTRHDRNNEVQVKVNNAPTIVLW